jgi:hypothetical protein
MAEQPESGSAILMQCYSTNSPSCLKDGNGVIPADGDINKLISEITKKEQRISFFNGEDFIYEISDFHKDTDDVELTLTKVEFSNKFADRQFPGALFHNENAFITITKGDQVKKVRLYTTWLNVNDTFKLAAFEWE